MLEGVKFDFDDILVCPVDTTDIKSRYKDIDIHTEDGMLPIFTAPMNTVVSRENIPVFLENQIHPIIPRTDMEYHDNSNFKSYGLHDIESILDSDEGLPDRVLIDVANGHMRTVYDVCERIKKEQPHVILMAGNIANPMSIYDYVHMEVDYVRVGIGAGSVCLTTQQTAIGYPMASLIQECRNIKERCNSNIKIVADGGLRNYSDIIKALVLGADYVMLGGVLNKAYESAATTTFRGRVINPLEKTYQEYMNEDITTVSAISILPPELNGLSDFKKEYYGMSTKTAQQILGNNELKTAEGTYRTQTVEYTLSGWRENFEHYLRSAMSYTNSSGLNNFIGCNHIIQITNNALNRFRK